jgi:hypothetical protein
MIQASVAVALLAGGAMRAQAQDEGSIVGWGVMVLVEQSALEDLAAPDFN